MPSVIKKILVVASLLVVWQLVYFIPTKEYKVIPPPTEIAVALLNITQSGEIFTHVFASVKRVLIGFSLAVFAGVSAGIFLGYYKKMGALLNPLIEILRPIPPIAWIPVAIIIFGLGDQSSYFIVFLGAFFPIFTSTLFGVTSLPQIYKNVALSFEVSRFTFFRKILFFSSLPYIFTGLKVGMGIAWMSVIAAELVGAQSGLGYFIQLNRVVSRIDNIIAGMIIIGVVGFLLIKILEYIEKKSIPWANK